MKTLLTSLRLLAVLTLLTGFAYPLLVWAAGHLWFRREAEGSLLVREGRLIGSALLAQPAPARRYFQSRPSGGDYTTVPSVASNLAWTSSRLTDLARKRRAAWSQADVPSDLLTASGSGLDPELSPEAVRIQVARVADPRRLAPDQRKQLDELVARLTLGGQITPRRINVLRLNLALDQLFPPQ